MPRHVLDEAHIHPSIRDTVARHQLPIVEEVIAAIQTNDVVVVGMAMNPFPKKACKALDDVGQAYKYLEYGNYFNTWRERNALKMWCGWPTFPLVFVKGSLIGGANDLRDLITSGEFKSLLSPG